MGLWLQGVRISKSIDGTIVIAEVALMFALEAPAILETFKGSGVDKTLRTDLIAT